MLIGFEKKWRCHELTLNETIQVDEHFICMCHNQAVKKKKKEDSIISRKNCIKTENRIWVKDRTATCFHCFSAWRHHFGRKGTGFLVPLARVWSSRRSMDKLPIDRLCSPGWDVWVSLRGNVHQLRRSLCISLSITRHQSCTRSRLPTNKLHMIGVTEAADDHCSAQRPRCGAVSQKKILHVHSLPVPTCSR